MRSWLFAVLARNRLGRLAPRGRSDTWVMATPLAVAAVALGLAIQLNNGAYTPAALFLVTVALVGAILAVALPRIGWVDAAGDEPAVFLLAVGLAVNLALILTTPAGVYMRADLDLHDYHPRLFAIAAVLAGAGLSRRPWLGRWQMPLLLGAYGLLGVWMVRSSPNPRIDVYAFHEEAYRVLARHQNPYAVRMPNIYGHTIWYAEGLADYRHVFVGFLYPPLSLLLTWPGHLLGDYRYVMVLAMTASAAFMAYARPGRLGRVAAAAFLFTPRSLFVVEQGWTEPLVVMLLSASVFCACRWPKVSSTALGLLLAVKQYSILLLPIAPLLLGPRRSWKESALFVVKAALVAAVITAPMALWSPRAFLDSVVIFQAKQPFRPDALSYLSWSARDGLAVWPQWLGFAGAGAALVVARLRAPQSPAGFAAASALVYIAFFAFAKQAFCNYYFMAVGILCCALAAIRVPIGDDRERA